MRDKIYVQQMEFYGYHGVFPEENKLGQRFYVDVIIETNLRKAGVTDDLSETVNYAHIYDICQTIVEGKPFKLIEAVAERIAEQILCAYTTVSSCTVKVTKPNPPIKGHYAYVAVEITRGR
ncbi:dihydroneopterin aldolase [Anoxybacillus flavithermus]|nr:dihydroneopterin aldolase [Anoxybacillus flavithermus]AST05850.1 dihydroneopterin aldolase [Anoxybacillus flavithermus]